MILFIDRHWKIPFRLRQTSLHKRDFGETFSIQFKLENLKGKRSELQAKHPIQIHLGMRGFQ